ncbi:MAG: cell division topological specificity factor MinE [Pseudomonadota bacterium]
MLMNFLRRNRQPSASASVAKERLQVILARENVDRNGPDYLPALRQDILAVIAKYVHVDQDNIKVTLDREGNREILELNVLLPGDGNRKVARL